MLWLLKINNKTILYQCIKSEEKDTGNLVEGEASKAIL